MRHRATTRFWEQYGKLPEEIHTLADKSFRILRDSPWHPSLQFKKVGKVWPARIGLAYRALAVEDGNDLLWVWIGSHDDYDRLIRGF